MNLCQFDKLDQLVKFDFSVDPRGIEPLFELCHSSVLPVYDGPHNMVDLTGVEPVISAMRMRRITNCATGPDYTAIIAEVAT